MPMLRVYGVGALTMLVLAMVGCAEPNKYDPNVARTDAQGGAGGSKSTDGSGGGGTSGGSPGEPAGAVRAASWTRPWRPVLRLMAAIPVTWAALPVTREPPAALAPWWRSAP